MARPPARPARAWTWLRHQLIDPEAPFVAVEVRPQSVGVVRVGRQRGALRLEAAVSLDLPAGAITPSILQPNVTDEEAFSRTLRGALERAGVLGGARVALVLPDPAARIALWPAKEVQARTREQVADIVRFKLRKSVPFDVRDAQVDMVQQPPADQALVVAIANPVLRGYEESCRAAGLEPGLVQPAALALVGALHDADAVGDALLVHWEQSYLTLVVARNGWPVLVRTLTGEASATPAGIAREIGSTLVYQRERLSGQTIASCVVRAPGRDAAEALDAVAAVVPVPPRIAEPWQGVVHDVPPAIAQSVGGALSSLAWAHGR